jgi:hypothetical protein
MARLGRRKPFKPILSGLIQYAPPAPPADPPVPFKAFVVSRIARNEASRRRHLPSRPITVTRLTVPGTVFPPVDAVRVQLTYVHEVDDDNPRTRKALQQLTDTNNGLLRSGELKINGRFSDPYLGYVPESTVNWGGVEPDSIREALDRLAAGSATIPGVSGVTPLVTSATLSDTINKVNELLAALGT